MLRRFFLAAATLFGLFVLFLVTVVANSRFTMLHPRDPNLKMLLTDRGAVLLKDEKESALESTKKVPKVEVIEPVFNFGSMFPDTRGKHSFEIRNIGTAPLTLSVASTSCKCTVGGVSANEVAPGDKAFVTLEWHAKFKDQEYSQSAEVQTNDPVRPRFSLRIEGKVRQPLGAEVLELVVPPITPGKSGIADVIIYSPNWENMEIVEIKTTLPGISTQLLPVEASELKRLEVKSAHRLRVTVPGDLPGGEFRDIIRIKAAPAGNHLEMAELELQLRGKVLPRYAILGPITERDGLVLGQVNQREGKTLRMSLKLRDDELSLPIRSIEVVPRYLKVTLEPHKEADLATPGLFDLTIEVPADAPVGQYLGNPHGNVRISTGHPRVPEIQFKVTLAVVP
jgi:hypothetical protein